MSWSAKGVLSSRHQSRRVAPRSDRVGRPNLAIRRRAAAQRSGRRRVHCRDGRIRPSRATVVYRRIGLREAATQADGGFKRAHSTGAWTRTLARFPGDSISDELWAAQDVSTEREIGRNGCPRPFENNIRTISAQRLTRLGPLRTHWHARSADAITGPAEARQNLSHSWNP